MYWTFSKYVTKIQNNCPKIFSKLHDNFERLCFFRSMFALTCTRFVSIETIRWIYKTTTLKALIVNFKLSQYDKSNNKTCATSEDSDQPAHPRSLIRVFADRMYLLQHPSHPKRDERNPCHTRWMNRLIWVFACYLVLTVGFIVRWLISF